MKEIAAFVQEHICDDTARLILNRSKWPEIDMDLAVASIESRRKLKNKVQEWHDHPGLVFPVRLSAEQCSSSATAQYKAQLAASIAGSQMRLADLTGGLGVDSWFFSKHASKVLYNEMQDQLCKAARYNFNELGIKNIDVSNLEIQADSPNLAKLLDEFKPDIVFMDPARRGEGGKKVFLIEDCTPDVLTLRKDLFAHTRHILIKLSPMADITMAAERLGRQCREIHIVAAGGECKELLIWMDRDWDGDYTVITCEIGNDSTEYQGLTFKSSEERESTAHPAEKPLEAAGKWLFEPGKALMKAGAFNLISARFGIGKLGRSTHYYIVDSFEQALQLRQYGKVYEILRCEPLDKRSIKAAGKDYPKAEVTARNIPMDTDTLRKKLGTVSGDNIHIFGLKSDTAGNLLTVTSSKI